MQKNQLNVGDKAPDFDLPRDGEGNLAHTDFQGKTLVLYFYPRDDTKGCTIQAIDFTHALDAFEKLGAVVVGVSKDSTQSHDKFVKKHALGIPLLSDEDGELCEAYGVWVEKKMYGKTFMGIERTTAIIQNGLITHLWHKVKAEGHVGEVLAALQNS